MGQGMSCIRQLADNDNHFVFSGSTETIKCDITQSHMVSFAINHQSDGQRSLGQFVVNDAKLISETFVQTGTVPYNNATVHIASEDAESCTFEGMKRRFVTKAKSVQKEGRFVFHFIGHGIQIGDDRWGLAPSDFDHTERTCVMAKDLNDWLTEAECKAKHILFTLNCCYAGGIADALIMTRTASLSHSSLSVVSACSAKESSNNKHTLMLGNSMFCHFLAMSARKETRDPQKLPVHKILMECSTCCKALSSLMVKYSTARSVSSCQIVPEIASAGSIDEPDNAIDFSNSPFMTKYYDYSAQERTMTLHAKTNTWLQRITRNQLLCSMIGVSSLERY